MAKVKESKVKYIDDAVITNEQIRKPEEISGLVSDCKASEQSYGAEVCTEQKKVDFDDFNFGEHPDIFANNNIKLKTPGDTAGIIS